MSYPKINRYKWKLNNAKIVLGVTGTVSSGKTTLANYLGKMGALVLDADDYVSKQLKRQSPVYKKIVKKFSDRSLNPDGTINKTFLAEKIFSDEKLRTWLENILHPYILKEFKTKITQTSKKIIVCDIPLLFEKKLDDWFHLTICVDAKKEIRLERAAKKRWTSNRFYAICKNQLSPREKKLRADICLDNSGSLSKLEKKAEKIYFILKISK